MTISYKGDNFLCFCVRNGLLCTNGLSIYQRSALRHPPAQNLDLDFNGQVYMANQNTKQIYDFNEVPGATEDLYNCITIYKGPEKSTKRSVLTNIWQPAHFRPFTSPNCECIPDSKFTTNCQTRKTKFSLTLAGELVLVFVPRNCERFHFGQK